MTKAEFILVNPDNGHYTADEGGEEIDAQAVYWDVRVLSTDRTRDTCRGQEEEYSIEGSEEDINETLR